MKADELEAEMKSHAYRQSVAELTADRDQLLKELAGIACPTAEASRREGFEGHNCGHCPSCRARARLEAMKNVQS